MKVSPADRPKVIVLLVLIFGFMAFAAIRFLGNKPPEPAAVAGASPNPEAGLPTTSQIADGQIVQPKAVVVAENLHQVFSESGDLGPVGNPFRMPVPPVKETAPDNGNAPGGTISAPSAGNPGAPIRFGDGGVGPFPIDPNGGGAPGAEITPLASVMVKGIITPEDGSAPLAFLKVGDKTKGFRVGQLIAPGMKVVGIDSTKVSIKIGASTIQAGVGQEVKPS